MRLPGARSLSLVLLALVCVQLGSLLERFVPAGLAFADPVGMSVSGGKNPVQTITGTLTSTSLTTIYTVPNDKIFIITDINVSGNYGQYDWFRLYNQSTSKYLWSGSWNLYSVSYTFVPAAQRFTTGMSIAPGSVIQAQVYNGYTNYYTITGYLARP